MTRTSFSLFKVFRRTKLVLYQIIKIKTFIPNLRQQKIVRSTEDFNKSDTWLIIIIHVFWLDEFAYILEKIAKLDIQFDIIITSSKIASAQRVLQNFSNKIDLSKCRLIEVHNRGRDLDSFVYIMQNFDLSRYDMLIKVHTKKSQAFWFKALINSLLSSSKIIEKFRKILELEPNSLITHPLFIYPGILCDKKDPALLKIFNYYSEKNLQFPKSWYFAAGTMFACDPKILQNYMRNLIINFGQNFETEEGYTQGSLAHIYEKMIGISYGQNDGRFVMTSMRGYFDIKAYFVRML